MERFGQRGHAPGDVQRLDLFLEVDHVQQDRVLLGGGGLFAGLFQNFGTLAVEPLVVENAGEIELFAQLDRHRMLDAEQTQAHQNLFVEMGLHVGKLLLFDRTFLEHFPLVVFLQCVEAVEQGDEFGLLVAGQAGGVELEIAFFGLGHGFDQVEHRFLFLSGGHGFCV